MTITVNELYADLISWGYDATLEPEEMKPPGRIGLTYDMGVKPEDVGMTSYEVKHKVMFDWTEAQPDTIATTITTLMGHLGLKYAMQDRFEIGDPKLVRGNGTMYKVMLPVYWIQWVTVNV